MVYTYVRADGGGGSTSTGRPQFERHYPSATTVEGDATTVRNTADAFETLSDDVVSKHNEAKSNVEGDPRSGMDGATTEAKTKSTNLYRRAIVAGGALQVYSEAIHTFNESVKGWNRKINAADDDEKAEKIYENHTGDYAAAVETLEDAATTGKSQLTKWDDDKTVKNLWAAGALPTSATAMLPGIGLEYSDLTGLPPDLAALSDKELAKRLQNDPELRNNEDVMADVGDHIDSYNPDDASADASQLADGDRETAGKLALLNVYGEYAQEHDKTIPVNAAEYLRNIVGELFPGGDDSAEGTLPYATATQEALDDASIGNWTTGMLANSLLLASDGRLDPTPHHGPAKPILGNSAVPQSVMDALHDTPGPGGTGPGSTSTLVKSGEGFSQLATLLGDSDSDIEAGTAFSREITHTTAEVARWINASGDGDSPGAGFMAKRGFEVDGEEVENLSHFFSGDMQTMLDVATRNETANTMFLTGANNNSDTAQDLISLYNFDWKDDGESVAGYTNWINDALKPGATQDERDLAHEASGALIDAITTTGDPNNPDDFNPFKELMTNAGHSDVEGEQSFGDFNPRLADSLVNVASRNLDALSTDPGVAGDRVEYHPSEDGSDSRIEISGRDRGRLFTLLATDDEAYNSLGRNVGAYQQVNLNHAIENEESANAAMENSRLDAYVRAGFLNNRMVENNGEYKADMTDYQQTRAAMEMGRDAITTTAAASGWGGVAVAPAANTILNGVIDSVLDEPELQTYDTSTEENEDYATTAAGYSYLVARYHHDPASLTTAERELITDGEGDVLPFNEVEGRDRDMLSEKRDYTDSDGASDAERGRNEYVMNNKYDDTFEEIYHGDDIDKYLNGETPASDVDGS